ncbi:MAG: tRNA preQ1(34) S-adenosylmethionine ribosyltransferase-isomerase QueA [Myxococcota bacterium]
MGLPDPRPDLADYDFTLPPEQIAQEPPAERDAGRLLILSRADGGVRHASVRELPGALEPGDLLVVNTTRVRPARLRGAKQTGGAAEALVLEDRGQGRFEALVRCRGKLRVGSKFRFEGRGIRAEAEIMSLLGDGRVVLAFEPGTSPDAMGEAPLPPYIRRERPDARDDARYQTVFARETGAVAAPTAGLHFSDRVLADLAARGVERAEVVLHVGPGTFRPVGEKELASGRLHRERYHLPEETARAIARTRQRGGRVVAVGTTTCRVLETCATEDREVTPGRGETDLFLRPGARFRGVDALLTNFHLPRSSLLMLVAAFAGRERVLAAYRAAVAAGYRFYSYGDAMLIL